MKKKDERIRDHIDCRHTTDSSDHMFMVTDREASVGLQYEVCQCVNSASLSEQHGELGM